MDLSLLLVESSMHGLVVSALLRRRWGDRVTGCAYPSSR
jgi:hypothetical protein